MSNDWQEDSLRWRGKVLTGQHGHWCPDWDYLPIDETCPEWPCPCSASDGWQGPIQEFAYSGTLHVERLQAELDELTEAEERHHGRD